MQHNDRTSSGQAPSRAAAFDLQGHRGARGLMPENTIPSFLKALELEVTTLEMDAVISGDRKVVISHEPYFSSVICSLPSGEPVTELDERNRRMFEMTYDEIAAFDCGLRVHPRFPQQQKMRASKPLLREVVKAAESYVEAHGLDPVRYNIETKSAPSGDGVLHPSPDEFVRLIYQVLVETGIKSRTTLQSFDVRTLQVARRIDPALSLALLVERSQGGSLEEHLEVLGFVPEIYSPEYTLVDARLVEEAHRRKMQVIPWTVNTAPEMRQLKEMGVDGLITDYPDLGRELLDVLP